MIFRVECFTLFDITQTGVINRNKPVEGEDPIVWLHKRNTQCNFDTILQGISLRSQPENISIPKVEKVKLEENEYFGFLLDNEEPVNNWSFTFTVHHTSVFSDGVSDLGSLYSDCDQIPMIKTSTSWDKLPNFLDTSEEMRNIYFRVIENDE